MKLPFGASVETLAATCTRHGAALERHTFGKLVSEPLCLECVAESDRLAEREETERKAVETQERVTAGLSEAGIPPRFHAGTFENYRVNGQRQVAAKAAAEGIATKILAGKMAGGVFAGTCGTGKNHLASAICHRIGRHGKTFVVTEVAKLVRALKESWRKDSKVPESELLRRVVTPDLLVLDEVGVQFGSDTERNFVTEIINDRYGWNRSTLILTNLSPKAMVAIIGERAADRIAECGGVVPFNWPSHRRPS